MSEKIAMNPMNQGFYYPPMPMMQPQMDPQLSEKITSMAENIDKIMAFVQKLDQPQQPTDVPDAPQTPGKSRKARKGKAKLYKRIEQPTLIPRFESKDIEAIYSKWRELEKFESKPFEENSDCVKIARILLTKPESSLAIPKEKQQYLSDSQNELHKLFSDVVVLCLLRDMEEYRLNKFEEIDEGDLILNDQDVPEGSVEISKPRSTSTTKKPSYIDVKIAGNAYTLYTKAIRKMPDNRELLAKYEFSSQNNILSQKWNPKTTNLRAVSQTTKNFFIQKGRYYDQLRYHAEITFSKFESTVGKDIDKFFPL